jgi:dihydrofolate reductase
MVKLIYSAITSLDGYVADERGKFDWSAPDDEVHRFVNDLERPIGTYLYGRRMYEVMVYWETAHTVADQPPFIRDYTEIWQAADKIVYSKTLDEASSARTGIEREFDPEQVRQLKAQAERDLSVGGPDLAAQFDQGRAGRRVPPVRHAHRGGRRHTVPPRRCSTAARTAC